MALTPQFFLTIFRHGMDTQQIADTYGLSEASVSRKIFVARCRELKLPAQIQRFSKVVNLNSEAA